MKTHLPGRIAFKPIYHAGVQVGIAATFDSRAAYNRTLELIHGWGLLLTVDALYDDGFDISFAPPAQIHLVQDGSLYIATSVR